MRTASTPCLYHARMDIEAIEKRYNIRIRQDRRPVRPVPIDLASAEGHRRVLDTARRVMATHADVLAALARR